MAVWPMEQKTNAAAGSWLKVSVADMDDIEFPSCCPNMRKTCTLLDGMVAKL
jgi:hypothetical protein